MNYDHGDNVYPPLTPGERGLLGVPEGTQMEGLNLGQMRNLGEIRRAEARSRAFRYQVSAFLSVGVVLALLTFVGYPISAAIYDMLRAPRPAPVVISKDEAEEMWFPMGTLEGLPVSLCVRPGSREAYLVGEEIGAVAMTDAAIATGEGERPLVKGSVLRGTDEGRVCNDH